MRWQTNLTLIVALVGADAVLAQSPASKIAPQKGWLNDYASARTLALKTGKPMMIVFRCDP